MSPTTIAPMCAHPGASKEPVAKGQDRERRYRFSVAAAPWACCYSSPEPRERSRRSLLNFSKGSPRMFRSRWIILIALKPDVWLKSRKIALPECSPR
jgi:hypothetical protein